MTKSLEHYPEEVFPIEGLEDRDDLRYKIVNIVIIAYTGSKINRQLFCNCAPILEIEDFVHKPSKLAIPYYGRENSIVSCNYDDMSRGIRHIKKPLKKIMYLDFQLYGKNQHIKVSEDNIHITGIRSEKAGHICIDSVLDMMKQIDKMLALVRQQDEEIKRFIFYMLLDGKVNLHMGDGTVYTPEYPLEECKGVFDSLVEETPALSHIYKFLTVNRETRMRDNFENYMVFLHDTLFSTKEICLPDISVDKFVVHNKVFYINTQWYINLRKVNKIAHKLGHSVIFYNWRDMQSTEIVISDDENPALSTNLKIHKSGGVNLWCDSDSSRAFRAFKKALVFLEPSYVSKCTKRRKHERRTPRNQI